MYSARYAVAKGEDFHLFYVSKTWHRGSQSINIATRPFDSPCIAKVARATGRVVELCIQRVMLLQKVRIFIYFTLAKLWHRGHLS